MEVPNTVQEAVTKTILEEKKCSKAKWLSEEVLQIAEERREVKGKGKKERYTYVDVEFINWLNLNVINQWYIINDCIMSHVEIWYIMFFYT